MKRCLALFLLCTLSAPQMVAARSSSHYHHRYASSSEYYTNVSGHHVHRPMRASRAPSGASAHCYDGSWSFSEHHQGTCSHHGGVERWM